MACDNKFLIAYSGGLDSHVLLHRLVIQRDNNSEIKLRAVHVHHGLHEDADKWTAHCQKICDELNVELIIKKIQIEKGSKLGIEAAARNARYRVFESLLENNETLVTAHHQDDQAETVLLQLLRGAGPKGLAAMPECAKFGCGEHARPLLNFTRKQLQEYAQQHQLHWLEDPSNLETGFNRNYLRHEIMPLLEKRWKGVAAVLSRSAQNCADASKILDEVAKQDLEKVICSVEQKNILSVKKLLQLNKETLFNVIRYWLDQLDLSLPSRIKLEQIEKEVLRAREDAMPLVKWEGVEIRRYRDGLYAMPPLEEFDPNQIISWDIQKPLTLPGKLGILTSDQLEKNQVKLDNSKNVTIRFRQGGEKIKKLFQEKGIPPWQRDRVPLLYSDGEFVGVVEVGK